MLNIIWGTIFILSIICSAVNGTLPKLTTAIFDASAKSVNLTVTLTATVCFWSGIMQITSDCGAADKIAVLLSPIIKILFPELKQNKRALNAIVMNMTANLLGLGNAATPLGLEAMRELDRVNPCRSVASDSMCRFVVLNTASLQLIPTTIIGLRAAYGSVNPASVIVPVWLTSIITLISGIMCTKIFDGRKRYE